MSITASTG